MMTLIALVIIVSYAYSVGATSVATTATWTCMCSARKGATRLSNSMPRS